MNKWVLSCLFSISTLFSISRSNTVLASEADYNFYGRHLILSYKNCNIDALNDVENLKATFLEAIRASGTTCLETCDYAFEPQGFTLVALLSESHASIHTYPELGSCFVDLFTCGTNCNNDAFEQVLATYLKPKSRHHIFLERN